jgi:hypothetical protein
MLNSNSIASAVGYIGSNPLLTVLSFAVAIVSVAITVIIYLKSRREKIPCYNINSYNVITDFVNMFDSLEILYSGQAVKNLTVSKIVFWNAGRETIDMADIVEADPIMILVNKGHKILDEKIIAMNNETNNFSLTKSDDYSKVNIKFDYIDKNDGAVIQIIHTGKSNKNIEIRGRVKGVGKIKPTKVNFISNKLDLLAVFILGLLAGVVYLYFAIPMIVDKEYVKLALLFILLVICLLSIIKIEDMCVKKLSKLPKGLEIFMDEYYKS